MIFKILGSGSGFPEIGKSNPSLWVTFDNQNVIFDAGEGLSHKLLENDLGKDEIDAIVISHFHPDHISGIFLCLQMFKLQNRTKPLKLFIPEQIEKFLEVMDMFYLFPESLNFTINIFKVEELPNIYYNIIPYENSHLKDKGKFVSENQLANELKSFSFVIEDNDKTLVYSSDIVDLRHLENEIESADILILDGIHPQIEIVKDLIDYKNLRIIITHGCSQRLQKFIENNQNKKIEYADEEKVIEL